MGLFDRISRVVKAELNSVSSKDYDPEEVLERTIIEMQEDLVQLRQGVAQAIASQKRTEQQYSQSQNEANKWLRNAHLALQEGDENRARQALERKRSFAETANTLKVQLDQETGQIDTLKRSVIGLESKIASAKTKKDMLKARISAAKAQEQLQDVVGRLGTSSAMAAFERMEEKVLMQEARAQSAAELVGADLESKFETKVTFGDIDDELAALKAQLLEQIDRSKSNQVADSEPKKLRDKELEELKAQLDML